jgi:putative ATP-dependent DNA ligase
MRLTRIGNWEYLRFNHKFKSLLEGTVSLDDTVIWGYPKIGRILQLDTGIAAQFEQPFWVEEKIDGYNVRIFRHHDEILALTRRGYICPFTTDRVSDFINTAFFEARPDLVLCVEVAGPENPYNEGSPPFIGEDVRFFVFDIMRQGQPGFLPHQEKRQLLETYGLPNVALFGKYQIRDGKALRDLMLQLDDEGREGIVMKEDSAQEKRVKYVTGRINVRDIQVSERGIQQLPAEYVMHRILRLVLFMEENDIAPTPALYQELGESLIAGTLDAIRQCREQHKVFRRYRCRFRQRANAELMMRSLRRLLGKGQVRQRRLSEEGGFAVLEFEKVLPRTTGLFQHLLTGGIVFD